jgi:ADP-ribose pyrophosphatase YjhB (NUDIX family)
MRYLRLRYGHFGVGVAALIQDEQGRVLLVHRTYSHEEPWGLPGGWLEGADSLEETVRRELREETGLAVRVRGVAAAQRADFAVVILLRADLEAPAGTEPTLAFRPSAEVSEVAWVQPDDAARLSPLNAALIRRALA